MTKKSTSKKKPSSATQLRAELDAANHRVAELQEQLAAKDAGRIKDQRALEAEQKAHRDTLDKLGTATQEKSRLRRFLKLVRNFIDHELGDAAFGLPLAALLGVAGVAMMASRFLGN